MVWNSSAIVTLVFYSYIAYSFTFLNSSCRLLIDCSDLRIYCNFDQFLSYSFLAGNAKSSKRVHKCAILILCCYFYCYFIFFSSYYNYLLFIYSSYFCIAVILLSSFCNSSDSYKFILLTKFDRYISDLSYTLLKNITAAKSS